MPAHSAQQGRTARVAQNTTDRRGAIDERTTSLPGYAVSQRVRWLIQEIVWLDEPGRWLPQDEAPRARADR